MIHKMACYTVNEQWMDQVIPVIEEYVEAIVRYEPATSYVAFRKGAGCEFIHFMSFRDKESEQEHLSAEYTKRFMKRVTPHCEATPKFTDLVSIISSID